MSASGLTRYAIGISDIGNLQIAVPPENEQLEIQEELEKYTKLSNQAIKAIESTISNLKELKTSLISNIVTGKVQINDLP